MSFTFATGQGKAKKFFGPTTRATWSARRARESPGRDKQSFFSFFFIVIVVSHSMKHIHSLVLPSTPHGVARPELLRRPTESGTSEVRRQRASHLRGLGCSRGGGSVQSKCFTFYRVVRCTRTKRTEAGAGSLPRPPSSNPTNVGETSPSWGLVPRLVFPGSPTRRVLAALPWIDQVWRQSMKRLRCVSPSCSCCGVCVRCCHRRRGGGGGCFLYDLISESYYQIVNHGVRFAVSETL